MTENERLTASIERLAIVEVQVSQNVDDIKELKADNKVIRDIATSVQVMATEMKGMSQQMAEVKDDISDVREKVNNDISKVKSKIADIETKPAKEIAANMSKIKWAALSAVGSMLATGIVSTIIALGIK